MLNKKPKVKSKEWTQEELEIMTRLFPDNYTIDLCKILGRTYSSVAGIAYNMGLKKSDDFKKMELKKQAERLKIDGAKYCFKKGCVPLNKGKSMSDEVYKKLKPTMFKKGHVPHNTNYDGHERVSVDGYIEVRIEKGVYALKHRLIFEAAHGKIPKGHIVAFKDRNKQNLAIENLALITMQENIERNSINRLPTELISVIKLLKKINKKINEKQN